MRSRHVAQRFAFTIASASKQLLPTVFPDVFPDVAPDVFCSYGGLVDVLEVRGRSSNNMGCMMTLPPPSCRRSRTARRCSSVLQLAQSAGAHVILARLHQPHTSRVMTVSLVGQIAKNVYQCKVIGSCRTRKCAAPRICVADTRVPCCLCPSLLLHSSLAPHVHNTCMHMPLNFGVTCLLMQVRHNSRLGL